MEKEVQFRGVWGIFKESVKLLIHHARLLLSLAAILVLPLCVVFLGNTLVTDPLVVEIQSTLQLLAAEISEGSPDAGKTTRELYAEFGRLGLILLVYNVSTLVFSLVATAAIVYSVACIYLEKTVTFSKALAIVPRVWKRLMVTFLWAYLIIFVIFVGILLLVGTGVSLIVLTIALMAMEDYFSMVWCLANVITVLEEGYGIAALKESARLVKGKRLVGFCLVLIYAFCRGVINFIFEAQVGNPQQPLLSRLLLGSLLVLALTLVHLIGIIVQGLSYFMVKSYHQESIDRMVLSDHLDAYYLGEYVALEA